MYLPKLTIWSSHTVTLQRATTHLGILFCTCCFQKLWKLYIKQLTDAGEPDKTFWWHVVVQLWHVFPSVQKYSGLRGNQDSSSEVKTERGPFLLKIESTDHITLSRVDLETGNSKNIIFTASAAFFWFSIDNIAIVKLTNDYNLKVSDICTYVVLTTPKNIIK